jgi:hypothetical protein
MADNAPMGLEILAMRKACEDMPPYKRADCCFCGFTTEVAVDGVTHCKWCGWQDDYPIKRDVPRA